MISGAGGRKFLSPTVHTTPGARGSPSGVALRMFSGLTHQAEMTWRLSQAELRHRHAAPAWTRESGGTPPHHPARSDCLPAPAAAPAASSARLITACPSPAPPPSSSLAGGGLTTVTGAPGRSACTKASAGARYRRSSRSAWVASRADTTRQFSDVMNQWNFSNHSGVRVLEMPPGPLATLRPTDSLARFSAAATARWFCARVLSCFTACFLRRSKCARALAYADIPSSSSTATVFGPLLRRVVCFVSVLDFDLVSGAASFFSTSSPASPTSSSPRAPPSS
mmetsp:Transcript_28552/g.71504  ORF Transcript_28552/g.71504 Transcript_28552/m.71504 type:complete len:281 (-) Transcript_28552:6-848(-)